MKLPAILEHRAAASRVAAAIGDVFDRRGVGAQGLTAMADRGHDLAGELAGLMPAGAARRIPADLLARVMAWSEPEYRLVLERLAASHPDHARVLGERWAYYVAQMERVKGLILRS